jgi:hypothetical protein
MFPEEQFGVACLRDLLASALRILADGELPAARKWLEKVEHETDDEQSEQCSITGLREAARQSGRRLVLFIENFNVLLEESLDDRMKSTLRRLLMTDPFMMIIGSANHLFDSLKRYDEAFFNYFGQVPLDPLDADQVVQLLRRRALFDHNERFLRELPNQQSKIRAITQISGGNPRLILMFYDVLTQNAGITVAQSLRRLTDELTPLLKHEMEKLPPQQRKIIHALMEKGGTATPTDLMEATRLPLNTITTQLTRLKDAQVLDLLGGGKGRSAFYTVPDKFFAIWYQVRYLSSNRRRVEAFVEMLRTWFEAQQPERASRQLGESVPSTGTYVVKEIAATPPELNLETDRGRFAYYWHHERHEAARGVLMNLADSTREAEPLVQFLSSLATPEMKAAWPLAWRIFSESRQRESRQVLEFLSPVCGALEGQPAAYVEALPPEQRDFVKTVLLGFSTNYKRQDMETPARY